MSFTLDNWKVLVSQQSSFLERLRAALTIIMVFAVCSFLLSSLPAGLSSVLDGISPLPALLFTFAITAAKVS